MTENSLRKTVFQKLEHTETADRLGKIVDYLLIALIAINVGSVILETVDSVASQYVELFTIIEVVSVAVFTLEYLARLWSCVEDPKLAGAKYPRLKYAVSPLALIDLLAILPFYLTFFFIMDLRFLRVLRLLRVLKLTRYSPALSIILEVIREERHSFYAAFFILMVLLILAASGAYLVEHRVQPDKFGSIPHAMWWAMATLTTVGYGDVTPITPMGQIFGSLVAIVGIGMAALPAGILTSGLTSQLRRNREALRNQLRSALEDGIIDETEETALEDLRKNLGLSRQIALEVRQDVHDRRLEHVGAHCVHCGKPHTVPRRKI